MSVRGPEMAPSMREHTAAYSTSLELLDPGNPELFRSNTHLPYFERLRRENPVHFVDSARLGPYWSVTRFQDIMAVDANHQMFSSRNFLGPSTTGGRGVPEGGLPMFIAMDPPKHSKHRKTVSPIFAPNNLATMQQMIRQRATTILDSLPIGEKFDWVDLVSIELTNQMLATLFDFPFEDRRKLTRWADVATAVPGGGVIENVEQKGQELVQCWHYFTRLWNERVNAEPQGDLISMLAHGETTRHMDPTEYQGNVLLLIVAGSDTTRNSITGGVVALNQHPDEYDKLRQNPSLVASMVSEIIRWQTPIAHMPRVALQDVEVGGKLIRKGDTVLMWYVSGNRDETEIERPDAFIIDRERPRHHLSFGFGIHRCVGSRLAEMQLTILWEEILKRFPVIEIVEEPKRVLSCFVQGYECLKVRIPTRY